MGVEFKLSDRELPVSPAFVEFLARWLSGIAFEREIWADQRSEALAGGDADAPRRAIEAAGTVMQHAKGRERIAHAYTLLYGLLTGDLAALESLQARFHFVGVIGIPRSGGSYLTAELYRALGMSPENVPGVVAHDSFPEAGPFQLQAGGNSWVMTLKTLAEYLSMVEVYFADRPRHGGRIIVPKKLTNAVYAGALYHRVLGEHSEYVVTVRHPVAACVSTYEKSGGLPPGGRFAVRSNIEAWCRRDVMWGGCAAEQLEQMDYFDVYLRYWEHYHSLLWSSGLAASRRLRVVAFGERALQGIAQGFHDRFGSGLLASAFHVSDRAPRLHPEWVARALPVIDRVADAWERAGLGFPREEIAACR